MDSATEFSQWSNQYRGWLITPKVETDEDGFRFQLAFNIHMEALRPILGRLAADAEALGIDSTPCHRCGGAIGTPAMTESLLDDVWDLTKRIDYKAAAVTRDQQEIPVDDFRQHQRKIALMLNESDEKWVSWNDFAIDASWNVGDIEKNATNLIANFNLSAENKQINWRLKRFKNGKQLGFQAFQV